jgi:hypothetical protein
MRRQLMSAFGGKADIAIGVHEAEAKLASSRGDRA